MPLAAEIGFVSSNRASRIYRVLNVADRCRTPEADAELAQFRRLRPLPELLDPRRRDRAELRS